MNQKVVWPQSPYFTIRDLFALNKDIVEITLRVKVSKSIEEGDVAEIGCIPGGKGRPQKVYSMFPISNNTLAVAKTNGIILIDNINSLIVSVPVSSVNKVDAASYPKHSLPV